MSQIQADATLATRLRDATGPTGIFDEAGRLLGVFEPMTVAPPGVAAAMSPTSHEELQERRKQREGGLPLAEVLKKIGAR